MEFSAGAWWLVATLAGIAVTVISYFLRRTISKTDELDRDVNLIKQTYVTKEELSMVKTEIRGDVQQLSREIKELKDTALTRADFYRSQSAVDAKIDRIYDLMMQDARERRADNDKSR